MAGTSSNRSEELARIKASENNNYNEFKNKPTASNYNPGFTKSRSPRDPANTSAGTKSPNGGPKQ